MWQIFNPVHVILTKLISKGKFYQTVVAGRSLSHTLVVVPFVFQKARTQTYTLLGLVACLIVFPLCPSCPRHLQPSIFSSDSQNKSLSVPDPRQWITLLISKPTNNKFSHLFKDLPMLIFNKVTCYFSLKCLLHLYPKLQHIIPFVAFFPSLLPVTLKVMLVLIIVWLWLNSQLRL